ncbi:unnamed protein product [Acanthoscelides obtectus]|uniref:Uncharacterized protein n=1 Tax=Acanthoscelides obtectus TaxID=200917 RepID=A0A9P0Q1P7_ACAOB|nr:unnamed protein product [Acanthoscelides obtectus]CAK1630524.1 hypothetical protein AOBTE_LOCUS6380 [Acanthoscelides obtectus]
MPRAHAAAPRLYISCKVSLLAALVILMATAGLLATSKATQTNTLRRYDYYTNGDHHFYHSKHTHSQQQQPFGSSSNSRTEEESWALSYSSVGSGGASGTVGKKRRREVSTAAISRVFFGINPWMPAQDVQEAVAASLQCPFDGGGARSQGGGARSEEGGTGTGFGCPPPCANAASALQVAAARTATTAANSHDDRSTQCLHYLQESHKEEVGFEYNTITFTDLKSSPAANPHFILFILDILLFVMFYKATLFSKTFKMLSSKEYWLKKSFT